MIVLNKEMAFISFYLAEKEYFIPDQLRGAISYIYFLINDKKKDKSLAIHIANEKYKKKYKVDYTKDYLRKMYNTRLAHIKNAKDKFKLWELDMRLRQYNIKKKLCECGCGEEVTKKGNRFIHGHHRRCLSKEEKILNAKHMRDIRATKSGDKIIDFKTYKNL